MTAPEATGLVCTGCAAPAEEGRFCTACGAPLQADAPPAALAPPPWLSPSAAPPVRRGRPNALAVLVLAALAVSAWALVRGVEQHTLTGTVSVVDGDQYALEPGDECFGEGGYDDLNAGAQVVVADEEGTTLSTGRLSPGEYDGFACVFSFALEDVTRADFYGLSVAGENRGELQYSYDELADGDWSVELSLGDD